MADAGEEGEEGEGLEEMPVEVPTVMCVKILGARGLPEESDPVTASYRYDLAKWRGEEDNAWEGESEPAAEGGVDQVLAFSQEHEVPKEASQLAEFLLDLVRQPLAFKVGGLAAGGGVFEVPLIDLVWLPPRNPDDDEDLPQLPVVSGWFKVRSEDPEAAEFPDTVEIHVAVELNRVILEEHEIKDANVIDLTVKSLHQLPAAWMLQEGDDPDEHKYAYTLRYTLPGVEKMNEIEVQPGKVVPKVLPPEPEEGGEEGEGDDSAAAATEDGAGAVESEEGEKAVAEETQLAKEPSEVEDWYTLQQTDRKVSTIASAKEQRIEFDHTHTQFMLPSACQKLKQSFHDRVLFPIEISRTLKDGGEYAYEKKYHGLAQLNIRGIAEEDVTFLSVRCPIGPHNDFDTPTVEEVEAMPEDQQEDEERLHDGTAANPYLLAETYVHIEIRMQVPLSPKPPPPPAPLPLVRDIIPKRQAVPIYVKEHSGVDRFRQDIKAVLAELQELFNDRSVPLDPNASQEAIDARRTQLLCYLSETGKMHEFKAKLKQSVAMMIREQFKQPGNLGGQSPETQKMISDLNAVLKDEINALLYSEFPAKKLAGDQDTEPLQLMLDKEKRLAEEAEINLDYGKATMHLNRRVVAVPKDPQLWYDLGSVVVRSGDIAKAQECFREAVTVDPAHVASLLAYGILMTIRDKFSEADKYFKESVSASPAHVLAWSCAVLFYDLESRDLERRTALKQMDTAQKKEKNPAGKVTKRSPYIRASQLCLEMGSTQMVEKAMTQELHRMGDSEELQVTLGRAYLMNRQFEKCRQHLQTALQLEKKSTVSMTLIGHSHYMENRWPDHRADMPLPPYKEAMAFYDKALSTKPPNTEVLQYIRLARIQIAIKKIAEAADTLKKCINMQPSATAWLGRAIALTMQEDYDRAEEALQEAVILDDHNAEVWGMTAIVALHQSTADGGLYQPKADEAVRAINRALKGGLGTKETFPTSEFILQQAGNMFLKIGNYDSSAASLRRALTTAQGNEAIFSLNKSLAECCAALNDVPSMIEAHRKCGELATTKADWEIAVRALIKTTEHQSKAQSKKYSELLKKDVWTQGLALP